jgi:hypothetical protein
LREFPIGIALSVIAESFFIKIAEPAEVGTVDATRDEGDKIDEMNEELATMFGEPRGSAEDLVE